MQQALDAACDGSTGSITACQDAFTALSVNAGSCTATVNNPRIICTGQCRQYYDDVIDNCDETVSLVALYRVKLFVCVHT